MNNITNVLGKFDEKREGAAIQLLMKPARGNWRFKGREAAHKMQQGRRLSEVKRDTPVRQFLRGFYKFFLHKGERSETETTPSNRKDPVQLTPEEQETIKRIEAKANKPGFKTNIRLVASALSAGTGRADSRGTRKCFYPI